MREWSKSFKNKLILPDQLAQSVKVIKGKGQTIATLNGSFDLLHAGHLHMIYTASQTADVLIVALNSDSSIQKYKSPDRPIIPLNERLQLMAALEFVDYVTYFDETDPITLLSVIKPDVHVNGSEYGENCIEADTVKKYGGSIYVVDLVDGLSTSKIIQKISSPKENHAPALHIQK
jgi:D-glycero-beta-D-manno-heptose 1-phosphate adenylyltransferase